jgi:hypothetical protein
MRIPTLGALTLAAAAAVVALPTTANAAAPVGVDDSVGTEFEKPVVVNVLGNDTDADAGTALAVSGKTDGTHGTVDCSTSACTYTPAADWLGEDTFTYTVTDGVNSDTATVTVTTLNVFQISLSSSPANVVATNHPEDPDFPNWTATDRNPTHKVTGVVTGTGGVLLKDVQVQLYKRTSLGATPKDAVGAPVTSDANGKIVVTGLQPIQKTYYSWKAVSSGKNSQERSVTVTPFLTTKFGDAKYAKGGTTTVSAFSGPVTAGQDVVLQKKDAVNGWTDVQTLQFQDVASDNSSTVTFAGIQHTASGTYLYRVIVPQSDSLGREQATSGQKTVSVYNADITGIHAENSDEFVTVKNNGKVAFNLLGWQLKDSNTTITLPSRAVAAGGTVKIHTGKGTSNSKNLYLRKGSFLWANSGTVTLLDDANPKVTMDSISYP